MAEADRGSMIPYAGSKESNGVALGILQSLPAAARLYDLFGGGGSVTEAAFKFASKGILGHYRKWEHIHYNELDKGVYELCKAVWEGTFDFNKARRTWISRERFFAEKDLPTAWGAYVRFCWSFGNSGRQYIYGEKLELAKRLMHALVTCDNSIIRGDTAKERRLALKKICRHKSISQLQSLESLERLQSLERLERLERLQSLERLQMTNLDYREVRIEPNSVAYCDIPYDGSRLDYGAPFDHPAFYEWAKTRAFPVYHSGYTCTDPFFKCVWEKEVRCLMAKSAENKGIRKTEKLFWNGRGI